MQTYDLRDFIDPVQLEFEGMEFYAPRGYKEILHTMYGESYMNPHPWNEYKTRHGFYSVEQPAEYYKQRFSGLLKPVPDKKIILIGEQKVFEAFQRKYPHVKVSETVRIPMDSIPKPNNDFYPIICSADARKVEKLLQAAGYQEYYFFWAVREWILRANVSSIYRDLSIDKYSDIR